MLRTSPAFRQPPRQLMKIPLRQASSTGPAALAASATTHQGGGVVGKRLQTQLLSDALTREQRNWEAREGQGSEPREAGGLRNQAGGVS